MYTITVSQKGQVVLPAPLRRKYNLKKGSKLLVKDERAGILIAPAGADHISRMRGSIKAEGSVTEFLLKERAEDYAMMEKKWKK